MADSSKYSVSEFERRFLLSALPSDLSQPRRIHDLYIEGTRLRLRTIEDMKGGVLQRKLGHKRRMEDGDPTAVDHTSLYLNEAEFGVLSSLPGRSLVKVRWLVEANDRSGAVDVFEGELQGLAMLEVDCHTQEEMDAYAPPDWAGEEVSHLDELSGGMLSRLRFEEVESLLNKVATSPTP